MHSYKELMQLYASHFDQYTFPTFPATLYEPNTYFLKLGGKRIRPVLCLMGNELFSTLVDDVWHAANAIELFHNFTLIHDDIMDKANMRRGQETVPYRYGINTAILSGDVMMIKAYEELSKIDVSRISPIHSLFNKTAVEVCEGQQLDMDFEKEEQVDFERYERMIMLKTSVLLAASLKTGAILGGADSGQLELVYEFGKNLGLAFQVQDDYLDCYGGNAFGKKIGGDIMTNKKTFLLVQALEKANASELVELKKAMLLTTDEKVNTILELYSTIGIDKAVQQLKQQYQDRALQAIEQITVTQERKEPLLQLAHDLLNRTA